MTFGDIHTSQTYASETATNWAEAYPIIIGAPWMLGALIAALLAWGLWSGFVSKEERQMTRDGRLSKAAAKRKLQKQESGDE